MSKWEMVRLGDVCDNKIKSIPANYDKEMYYVDIASVDNERKEITIYQRISGKEAPSRAKQILRYQDVIVSTVRPNLNAVAIYKAKQEIDVIASTGYCVLRSQEKILPAYLFSFCKSTSFIVRLTKIAKGASYPAVSNSDVRALELPLPSLEEQKKIANELDKIDDLIAKRKEQIEKLDLLIKAKFIEMFGDPVTNPMRWGKASLSMLGELNRGVSKHRPRNDPSLLGGVYPLIQTGEIANADLYITFYKNTYSELGLKQSRLWKNGTLCITIAANIAKTAILKFDACFPDSVVGFFPNGRRLRFVISLI